MLKFDEHKHLYTWNDKPEVSVTQLFSRIATRKEDSAPWTSISGVEFMKSNVPAIFGTEFHKIPEIMLNGDEPIYDPVFKPWVNSLNMFFAAHSYLLSDDTTKLVECKLHSEKYKYAGTLDLFCFHTDTLGRIWLIDWKTSASIAKQYKWQLAAYVQLIKENFNIKKGISTMTVRIRKNKLPQLQIRKPYEVKSDFNMFLSFLNVYNCKGR